MNLYNKNSVEICTVEQVLQLEAIKIVYMKVSPSQLEEFHSMIWMETLSKVNLVILPHHLNLLTLMYQQISKLLNHR